MNSVKVRNMNSDSGREIANQFTINIGNVCYFQSYKSIIVKKEMINGVVSITLDSTYWDYSKTTGKYRNIFLGEHKADTERKIKSGEYKLSDLNK